VFLDITYHSIYCLIRSWTEAKIRKIEKAAGKKKAQG